MKKLLLLTLALVIGFTAISQVAKVPKQLLNTPKTVKIQKPLQDLPDNYSAPVNPTVESRDIALDPSETILGSSYYDLWSNYSYCSRLFRYADGTMAATWTRGMTPSAYPDRGTGYNFYNGSEWAAQPDARIESVRTGWGSYAPLGLNGEIIVAHNGAGLEISQRDTRFTGTWTETAYAGSASPCYPTWPKVVTSGDENQYQHIFYTSYNSGSAAICGTIQYTRTSDGGATWDPQDIMLDGMGTDEYLGFGSEAYVCAAKGDIVALFVAYTWTDMFIMKSIDNGDTWQKIMVREFPIPFYDLETMALDTTFVCDNSATLVIDNSGKCHVAFGISRVLEDLSQPGYYTLFPWIDGIVYWNEDMPPFSADLQALAPPYYPQYPNTELIEDYNYVGFSPDVNDNGVGDFIVTADQLPMTYNTIGLSSMPTMTIDDQNQIFLAWSSYTETFDNSFYNYHKIWARAYANGVWGPLDHVTGSIVHFFDESIWPYFAPTSDDNVHLIYNTDMYPGYSLRSPTPDHDPVENFIYYAAIPKDDLLTGIGDNHPINSTGVSQNYPNPFDGETTITVNLQKAADLSMVVSNTLGQQVMEIKKGNVSAGTYYFHVDGSKLQDGMYFYTVKANDSEVTRKMINR
jgi:hypothetical protein